MLGGARAAVPDTVSERRQRNGPCLHVPGGLSQKGPSASLLLVAEKGYAASSRLASRPFWLNVVRDKVHNRL